MLIGQIKKQNLSFVEYKKFTLCSKTHNLEVKEWKKVFKENGSRKEVNVTILSFDNTDLKLPSQKGHKKTLHSAQENN